MPQLVIVEGPDMGKTFEIGASSAIGTASANEVVIRDRRAAERQATIVAAAAGWLLTNVDPSRSVMVNGEVLVEACLHHGDMISIAGTMLLFSDDAAQAEVPPPAEEEEQLATSQILSRKSGFADAQQILDHFTVQSPRPDKNQQRLVTLYKIAAAINETLELEQMLEQLMAAIFAEFPADHGFLMLAEEGRLQPKRCIAWDKRRGRLDGAPRYSRTVTDEVVRGREGILSSNVADDERFLSGQSIIDQGMLSTMCVPLLRQDKLLGVLQLVSQSAARAFTADDLDHLSKIAVQAAVAIETIATYEEPRRFSTQLRSLGKVTQSLSSYLQSEEIIKETVTFACSIFQCQQASIMLADEGSGKLKMAYAIGIPREIWEMIELAPGQGYTGRVVAAGQPLLVPDPRTRQAPEGIVTRRRERYRTDSFLIVPIVARTSEIDPEQRVIGAINVTDKLDGRIFSLNDQELLTILAHQTGIALANASLYEKATVDTLTRLFVRRYFFQRLSELIRKCRRQEKPLSLLMFDIDHFKQFNDRFGHQAGDEVLQRTGALVKRAVRGKDVPARYGGEEFAVILPDTPLEIGSRVGERIRRAIAESPFEHGGAAHPVTVSVGICELLPEDTRESLIAKADAALYRAKHGGRDRVCLDRELAEEDR